jgi:hypothetical protein
MEHVTERQLRHCAHLAIGEWADLLLRRMARLQLNNDERKQFLECVLGFAWQLRVSDGSLIRAMRTVQRILHPGGPFTGEA